MQQTYLWCKLVLIAAVHNHSVDADSNADAVIGCQSYNTLAHAG